MISTNLSVRLLPACDCRGMDMMVDAYDSDEEGARKDEEEQTEKKVCWNGAVSACLYRDRRALFQHDRLECVGHGVPCRPCQCGYGKRTLHGAHCHPIYPAQSKVSAKDRKGKETQKLNNELSAINKFIEKRKAATLEKAAKRTKTD